MSATAISAAAQTFDSRLGTLSHLLTVGAESRAEPDAIFLGHRLVPDMLPLGAQVAFTCNQPRNFARWLSGAESEDLDLHVESLGVAERYIADTRALLVGHLSSEGSLPSRKHLVLGAEFTAELTGREYLEDFLLPNFYFHLVTSYAILRHAGVPFGKRDYMLHLLPKVQSRTA